MRVIGLLRRPSTTPRRLNALVGLIQWSQLVNRPLLSTLHHVYAFCGREPRDVAAPVPAEALSELGHVLALGCCFVVDLKKTWAPVIGASDASTSFGFGYAEFSCNPDVTRRAANAASDIGWGSLALVTAVFCDRFNLSLTGATQGRGEKVGRAKDFDKGRFTE